MDYGEMQIFVNDMARKTADAMDYASGWIIASRENTPTTYKGKGRPRKSDYAIYKHPFDGKLRQDINRS